MKVQLSSLKCSCHCFNEFPSYMTQHTSYCNSCQSTLCALCSQGRHQYASCKPELFVNQLLSAVYSFVINAPADELKLIDLQTGLHLGCSSCNSAIGLYRCGIQQVLCVKCSPGNSEIYKWSIHSKSGIETKFRSIICELGDTVMPNIRVQRPGINGILPVNISLQCKACAAAIEKVYADNNQRALHLFMLDGAPYCSRCGLNRYSYYPSKQHCGCVRRAFELIQCIPENQLHLLTYSKWISCHKHQNFLDDLTAVSADGLRCGLLRSFFKDGDIVNNLIPAKNQDSKAIAASTMSQALVVLPSRIVCSCGREDQLQNMFDCVTCSSYGICSVCLAKKHWKHEIQEAEKRLTIEMLNDCLETTRNKMLEYSGHAKELNRKTEEAFEKFCHAHGVVLMKAAKKSETVLLLQSLLTKENTSEIETSFNHIVESTDEFHKLIDNFCAKLLDVGEKASAE